MGEDQYMNISVEQELKFPDTAFLSSVLSPDQVSATKEVHQTPIQQLGRTVSQPAHSIFRHNLVVTLLSAAFSYA